MNLIKLLKDFAQSQGINEKEVDKFLTKFNKPRTIEDLLELPDDMLNHFSDLAELGDDLIKSYIEESYEPNRREVFTLDILSNALLDNIEYYEFLLEDGEITKKEFAKEIKKYKELENRMVKIKFGSVKWDW